MERIIIRTIVILFISCGDYQPKLNTRAYAPKNKLRIESLVHSIKSADLRCISIDENVEIREVSDEDKKVQVEAILKGEVPEKLPYLNVFDENLILNEVERKELIKDLEGFKVANLKMFKFHKYTSDYCNADENIIIERWTVKEKYSQSKDLTQIKIYHWSKRVKRINYYQRYIKVTKRSIPKTLEIFQNEDETLASFKINGKSIKVLPDGTDPVFVIVGKNKFNKETKERVKQQFFEMILSCD